MAKKWMQKAAASIKRRGTKGVFKRKAQRAGMSTQEYAASVTKPGSHASATTRKQAGLAKAFAHARHGGRKKKK